MIQLTEPISALTLASRVKTRGAGEREIKKALRKVLLKYKHQNEQDLFEKACAYIRQYYAL